MKAAGLAGVSRRRSTRTTISDERVRPACDLVDKNFYAEAPYQLWHHHVYPDLGRLPLHECRSRRLLPAHFRLGNGNDLRAQLVVDAMNVTLTQLRTTSVIHHSDQGSQCTSVAFGLRCKEAGVHLLVFRIVFPHSIDGKHLPVHCKGTIPQGACYRPRDGLNTGELRCLFRK